MMNNQSRQAHKTATLAEISLTDGSVLVGKVFMPPQGRLTDMLNDDRQFLPIETTEGAFLALAKSAIKQVKLPAAEAVYRGSNPYSILGVREGASAEELKKAYHQLSMVNHPDRIKGLGLGTDFQELATHNMARISSAYAEISRKMNVIGSSGFSADRDTGT